MAIKGLGGFHLVVDAYNEDAVRRLRQCKGRDGKPFAVMVADFEAARALAVFDEIEQSCLLDGRRPIVVATAREDHQLAPSVTTGLNTIGIMLPYTPIHVLLFGQAGKSRQTEGLDPSRAPIAYVMTSANPGG